MNFVDTLIARLRAFRQVRREADLSKQEAIDRLRQLRADHQRFYASESGKEQLKWLDEYEGRLLATAIIAADNAVRLSCLDQAKGLQAFRTYLDTLTKTD